MINIIKQVTYQFNSLLEVVEKQTLDTTQQQNEEISENNTNDARNVTPVVVPLHAVKSSHTILSVGQLEFPDLQHIKAYGAPQPSVWMTIHEQEFALNTTKLGRLKEQFVLTLVSTSESVDPSPSTHIFFLKPVRFSPILPNQVIKSSDWLEDFVNHLHRDYIQLTRSFQSLDCPLLQKYIRSKNPAETESPACSLCFVLRTPSGDKLYRYYTCIHFESHIYLVILQSSELLSFSKNLNAIYKIIKTVRPRFDLGPLTEASLDLPSDDEHEIIVGGSSSSSSSRNHISDSNSHLEPLIQAHGVLKQYRDAFSSSRLLSFVDADENHLLLGPYAFNIDPRSKLYPPNVNEPDTSILPIIIIAPDFESREEKLDTYFAFLQPFAIPYFSGHRRKAYDLLRKIRDVLEDGYDCVCESEVQSNPLLYPNTPYPASEVVAHPALVQACVLHRNGTIQYQLYVLSLYPKNLDMFSSDAQFMVQFVIFYSQHLHTFSQYRSELFYMLENSKWTGSGIVSALETNNPLSPSLRFQYSHDDDVLSRLDSASSSKRNIIKSPSRNSKNHPWLFGVLVYPDAIEGIFMGRASIRAKEIEVYLVFTYSGNVVFGIPESGVLTRFKIEDLSTDQQLDTGSYEFNPATESVIISRITSFDSHRYPSAIYAEATLIDSNILMVSGDGFGALDGFVMRKLIGFEPDDPNMREHFSHLSFVNPPLGRFNCPDRESDFIQFYNDGQCFVSDSFIMSFFGAELSAGWKFKLDYFTLDLISPSMDLSSFTILPIEVLDGKVTTIIIDNQTYKFQAAD